MKKSWFEFRLYWQGMRRLRILGIALLIVCLSISIIVPVAQWVEQSKREPVYHVTNANDLVSEITPEELEALLIQEIDDRMLCIPAIVISYTAPLMIFFLFSYLHSRRDSDFYHAIPYKRRCVYLSFVAAAMSWMLGIVILGGLASGLLWAINPYATFSFVGLLGQIGLCVLNVLFLSSFATVAMALTGTPTTSVVVYFLSLCSWRTVMGMAYLYIEAQSNLLLPQEVLGGYLSPDWIVSAGIVTGSYTWMQAIYALVIALGVFALGGWLYCIRNSEMAGRAVPNKWLQHVFRSAMTLPIALLLTLLLMTEDGDITVYLIITLTVLLVFYLYELLTTKRVRGMLKCTPWLGVIVLCCVLFAGSMHGTMYVSTHENYTVDRIEAVGLHDQSRSWLIYDDAKEADLAVSEYQVYRMMTVMSDDDTAIALAAKAFEASQLLEREGRFHHTTMDENDRWKVYTTIRLNFKLTNGQTVVRQMKMPLEDYAAFVQSFIEHEQISVFPRAEDTTSIRLYLFENTGADHLGIADWGYNGVNFYDIEGSEDIAALLAAMQADFVAMTAQEQISTLQMMEQSRIELRINTSDGQNWIYSFITGIDTPQTDALIRGWIADGRLKIEVDEGALKGTPYDLPMPEWNE